MAASLLVSGGLGFLAAPAFSQSCTVPQDIIIFNDNSGSISNTEFDSSQHAIASFASSFLASSPTSRIAVVNWGCLATTESDCRISAVRNWSSTASDFAYVSVNSTVNKIYRSYGNFSNSDSCGSTLPALSTNSDYLQQSLAALSTDLSGGTPPNSSPLLGPSTATPANTQILIFSDAYNIDDSQISSSGSFASSNALKAAGYKISVFNIFSSAGATRKFARVASVGGSYNGIIATDSGSPADPGGNTLPRRVVTATNYSSPINLISSVNCPSTISLQKALVGTGRINASDQFKMSASGDAAAVAASALASTTSAGTGTGTGTAVTASTGLITFEINPGTAYSLNETMAAGSTSTLTQYSQAVACANTGPTNVAAINGLPISVTPALGDAIVCTVTNAPGSADLSITKTNNLPGTVDQANDTLARGQTTIYRIIVTNNGPQSLTGAVVTDPAVPELTCTSLTCAGTACPSATPAVSALQSGLTLGTLAVGAANAVTLNLTCTVN